MAGEEHVRQDQQFVDPRAQTSLESGLQIDQLCGEFERLWRESDPPALETFLESGGEVDRPALLRELLAIELEYRTDRQEHFGSDEYLHRFPNDRALIELLFAELQQRGAQTAACQMRKKPDSNSATASVQPEQPGFLVDHPRYRLVRFLGAGGMGSVYLAEHRLMQRIVALKIIRPELLADSSARERFHHEIKAAARLIHPNIVAAFDAEQLGGHSVLAMEYVDGHDLASLLGANGPLSVPDACKFVQQAALGLQHAFEMGMVHRDIKPHNLMLSKSGQIKILDFGLAHFVSEVSGATQSGMLLGSIDYMAPEQAADSRSAQVQADIYSLGCTLYSLLTGHPPFPSGSLLDKLRSHADTPPPRVEGIPAGLWLVLARMLAKPSAERYQEPREVAIALEPFVAQSDLASARVRVAEARKGLWIGRPRSAGLAVVLLALAVTALLLFFKEPPAGTVPGASSTADTTADKSIPDEAQILFRTAQHQLSHRERKSTKGAIDNLKKAIAIAPSFAEAHAALANAYNLQGDYGWEMPDDTFPLAKASVKEALSINPSLAEAHLALAFVVHAYDCDLKLAEAEYQRALELNPKLIDAHHWYAWLLVQQSRIRAAGIQIDLAAKLGTTAIVLTNQGKIRYYSESYLEAEEKLQEALLVDSGFPHVRLDLALVYVEMKEWDKAMDEFAELSNSQEDKSDLIAATAYMHAKRGNAKEARELLTHLEEIASWEPVAYEIATIYAALNEPENAFMWLHQAFKHKSAWRTYVKVDPRLKPIRKDQRFQKFISAAGLGKTSD